MEYLLHFTIWIIAVVYSLYKVYQFSRNFDSIKQFSGDFSDGWSFIGRSKDVSDYEWNTWKMFALSLLPWLTIHFVGAEILRQKTNILKTWHCIVSFVLTLYKFGYLTLLIFLFQPITYYSVLKLHGKSSGIWICSCGFLIVVNLLKGIYEDNEMNSIAYMKDEDSYMMLIAVSWIQLRCISFCLDKIENINKINTLKDKNEEALSFLDILSYSFYLPFLFLGPLLLYNDFNKSFRKEEKLPLQRRLLNLGINLTHYLGWFFFTELALHFIYFNALQYKIEVVKMMPDWCLYGGGLWMGIFFYLKYLVVYGLAGSLAALDHIKPEFPPRCIARVHRYSQMWKYFDVGLHKFLIRYIYKPIIKDTDDIHFLIFVRALASFLCFTFVLFWHGAHHFIIVWTILNYLGILLESMGTTIARSTTYKNMKPKIFKTEIMNMRFNAFLATPILIFSALSNFYFFAGSDVGDIYVQRVFDQSISSFLVMFFCLYSSCRASQYLNNLNACPIKTS